MDHSKFDFNEDFLIPLESFFEQLNISTEVEIDDPNEGIVTFPKRLNIPTIGLLEFEERRKQELLRNMVGNQPSMWTWVMSKFSSS